MPSAAVQEAEAAQRSLREVLEANDWVEAGFLGSGANGPVVLVRKKCGGDAFALKRSDAAEIKALRELSDCRNIVALYDCFGGAGAGQISGSQMWTCLEYMDCGTLRTLIREWRPRSVPEHSAREVVGDVLCGLEDIHRKGWMHRDIKAENIGICVAPGGGRSARLLDFDTAVAVPRLGGRLSESIGTVEYMAPEVFAGCYNEVADCWSLGVVVFELFFGYRPFNDSCIDRVEEMVRNWERYLVIPSGVSEQQESLVKGLLERQEARLSSRDALAHAWLRRAAPGALGHAAAPPSPTPAKRRSPRLQRSLTMPASPASAARPERPAWPPTVLTPRAYDFAPVAPIEGFGEAASSSSRPAFANDDVDSLTRLRRGLSDWFAEHGGGPPAAFPLQPAQVPLQRPFVEPFGAASRRSPLVAAGAAGARRSTAPAAQLPLPMRGSQSVPQRSRLTMPEVAAWLGLGPGSIGASGVAGGQASPMASPAGSESGGFFRRRRYSARLEPDARLLPPSAPEHGGACEDEYDAEDQRRAEHLESVRRKTQETLDKLAAATVAAKSQADAAELRCQEAAAAAEAPPGAPGDDISPGSATHPPPAEGGEESDSSSGPLDELEHIETAHAHARSRTQEALRRLSVAVAGMLPQCITPARALATPRGGAAAAIQDGGRGAAEVASVRSPRGVSPRAVGVSPRGVSPRGVSPRASGVSPRGVSPRGVSPRNFSLRGVSPRGVSPRRISPRRVSPHPIGDDSDDDVAEGRARPPPAVMREHLEPDPMAHLNTVRARAQEKLRLMAEAADRAGCGQADSPALAPDMAAPSRTAAAHDHRFKRIACTPQLDGRRECRGAQQRLGRSQSLQLPLPPRLEAVSAIEGEEAGDSLAHLRGVRARTQDLLKKINAATSDVPAKREKREAWSSTPATGSTTPPVAMLRVTPFVEVITDEPVTPRSWLAEHRLHTERLLLGLKEASRLTAAGGAGASVLARGSGLGRGREAAAGGGAVPVSRSRSFASCSQSGSSGDDMSEEAFPAAEVCWADHLGMPPRRSGNRWGRYRVHL